jgi:hypothetical protein
MRKRFERPRGTVRRIDPEDPRSLDHPSHKEQWLELARMLGRLEARQEFYARNGGPPNDVIDLKARRIK